MKMIELIVVYNQFDTCCKYENILLLNLTEVDEDKVSQAPIQKEVSQAPIQKEKAKGNKLWMFHVCI